MASASVRRKPNKRLDRKPHTSMATETPSSSFSTYRKITVVAILFVSVVGLFIISSTIRSGASFDGYPESYRPVKFSNKAPEEFPDEIYSIKVVNEFPHDPRAFTQGLLYAGNDTLFESTGLNGQSSVREVALATGKVQAIHNMDDSKFGEGLTLLGERLYQVTWLDNTGFIYDRNNLSKSEIFTHNMKDGWGLATDGKVIFGSDGTSTLYQIDPNSLKVTQKHTVKYKNHEVHNVNELELVNGEIWANVWQTDCIARISQHTGIVRGWILLPHLRKGLVASGTYKIDVLNGIAWDRERNRIFVTGKLWPKLYEIKLQPVREKLDGIVERMCITRPSHFVNHRAVDIYPHVALQIFFE